uniref:AH domain-containing protein n=1 Tax=Romanomermis culicivorax TaxID=13658 RepID=A0A915J5Q1_ROMCU
MDNDFEVQDQSLKIGESLRLKLNTDDESDNHAKIHTTMGDDHKRRTSVVDVELEGTVEILLDMQHRYDNIIKLLIHNSNVLNKLIESQRLFQRNIPSMSRDCNENEIKIDFVLPTLLDVYSSILNFICQRLTTLCDVTFRDTIDSVHIYSKARSEYDRILSVDQSQPQNQHELEMMQSKCEKFRKNIETKMKLLQENKVKVMRKCLSLLEESNYAFYSGHYANLCEIRQRYNVPICPTTE